MRNPTVIEFSSKILRSIDLTALFINLQAKFIKENRIFTLSELVAYERKRKIKRKLIEIKKIQKEMTQYYTVIHKFNYNYIFKPQFSRIELANSQLTMHKS
jgi:hypothetical protein